MLRCQGMFAAFLRGQQTLAKMIGTIRRTVSFSQVYRIAQRARLRDGTLNLRAPIEGPRRSPEDRLEEITVRTTDWCSAAERRDAGFCLPPSPPSSSSRHHRHQAVDRTLRRPLTKACSYYKSLRLAEGFMRRSAACPCTKRCTAFSLTARAPATLPHH